MQTYRLTFCLYNQRVFTIVFHLQTSEGEAFASMAATALCDALRALYPGSVRFLFCLLWRVDGTLTAYSDLRLLAPYDSNKSVLNSLAGARNAETTRTFEGLLLYKENNREWSITKLLPGCVTPSDIGRVGKVENMRLDKDSPIMRVGMNFFNAVCKQLPLLDTVDTLEDGSIIDLNPTAITYVPACAIYNRTLEKRWLGWSDGSSALQEKVLSAFFTALNGANTYDKAIDLFNGSWQDNATPDGDAGTYCFLGSITAASAWFDIAFALGYTIPDPNPGLNYSITGIGAQTQTVPFTQEAYVESWDEVPPEIATLGTRGADIVLSCVQELYRCQRVLKACFDGLEEVRNNVLYPGRQTSLFIRDIRALWFFRIYDDDHGQYRVGTTEHPELLPGYPWFIIQSQCERQHAAYEVWDRWDGSRFAEVWADNFAQISHCVHSVKNTLALLLTQMNLASSEDFDRYAPGHPKYQYVEQRKEWAPGVDAPSYDLTGAACDWVETRTLQTPPGIKTVWPCIPPELAAKAPYSSRGPRTFHWDNTIHDPDASDFDYFAARVLDNAEMDWNTWYAERLSQWKHRNDDVYPPPGEDKPHR